MRDFEFGPRAKEVQEQRALVAALKLLVLGIGQENRYRRAVAGDNLRTFLRCLDQSAELSLSFLHLPHGFHSA